MPPTKKAPETPAKKLEEVPKQTTGIQRRPVPLAEEVSGSFAEKLKGVLKEIKRSTEEEVDAKVKRITAISRVAQLALARWHHLRWLRNDIAERMMDAGPNSPMRDHYRRTLLIVQLDIQATEGFIWPKK